MLGLRLICQGELIDENFERSRILLQRIDHFWQFIGGELLGITSVDIATSSVKFRWDYREVTDRLEVSHGATQSQRMVSKAQAALGSPCSRGSICVTTSFFI